MEGGMEGVKEHGGVSALSKDIRFVIVSDGRFVIVSVIPQNSSAC
jgi:hypothetical protein